MSNNLLLEVIVEEQRKLTRKIKDLQVSLDIWEKRWTQVNATLDDNTNQITQLKERIDMQHDKQIEAIKSSNEDIAAVIPAVEDKIIELSTPKKSFIDKIKKIRKIRKIRGGVRT